MTDGIEARAVGVDVGGTKLLAVALDASGAVVAEERLPSPRDGIELIEAIAALALAVGPVGALGVGLPGLVERGVLRFAANLPGIVELPAEQMLSERVGAPVVIDNDATLAGWGEHSVGAAVGVDDALVVTLGTGIGGGLILGGRLYNGAHGMAGEIGHVLVDPAGPPCPCGQRGCWSATRRVARSAASEVSLPRGARRRCCSTPPAAIRSRCGASTSSPPPAPAMAAPSG